MTDKAKPVTRRGLLQKSLRFAGLAAAGAVAVKLLGRSRCASARGVWQVDPAKCIQCGLCATACVLTPSAVKCVHSYAMCGYCKLCSGYFDPQPIALDTGAENQLCPVGAIQRTFIEDPYYEYTIDESLCVGCGKCVAGCEQYGNGSLYLQIMHDRCKNCNQCAIALRCPAQAISRVPADEPYRLKIGGQK